MQVDIICMPQAVIWREGNAIPRPGKSVWLRIVRVHYKKCRLTSRDINRGKELQSRRTAQVCDVGIDHIISMSEREICDSETACYRGIIGKDNRRYVRA